MKRLIFWVFTWQSSYSFAQSSQAIDFYSDYKEHEIKLASPNCQAILDNNANYEIETSESAVKVFAKAINKIGGLLIISCDSTTEIYALSYTNRRKNSLSQELDSFNFSREQSSYSINLSDSESSPAALSMSASDRSLKKVQVSMQRSNPDLSNLDFYDNSINLTHAFENFTIGYGATEKNVKSGQGRSLRFNSSIFGFSLNTTMSEFKNKTQKNLFTLSTPMPVGIRYSYTHEGPIKTQKMTRQFTSRIFNINNRARLELERESNSSQGSNVEIIKIANTSNLRVAQNSIGELQLKEECLEGKPCKLMEFALGLNYKQKDYNIETDYGIIPHKLKVTGKYLFTKKNYASLILSRNYKRYDWSADKDWIDTAENTEQETYALSLMRLEYNQGVNMFSVENSQPLYPEDNQISAFVKLGYRRETKKINFSANYQFSPYGSKKSHSGFVALTYYFDKNLRNAKIDLASHRVEGKLASSFSKTPISNAEIKFVQEGEVLLTTTTDESGFYRFSDIPPSGKYTIVANKNKNTISKNLKKKRSKQTQTLNLFIEDQLFVNIKFYVDSNKNNLYDEEDSSLQIVNLDPMIGESVVTVVGGRYRGNTISLKKQNEITVGINEAFLPLRFKLIGPDMLKLDTKNKDEIDVLLLLKEK